MRGAETSPPKRKCTLLADARSTTDRGRCVEWGSFDFLSCDTNPIRSYNLDQRHIEDKAYMARCEDAQLIELEKDPPVGIQALPYNRHELMPTVKYPRPIYVLSARLGWLDT